MALNGTSNFINGTYADIDPDGKFAAGVSNVATFGFAADAEYISDRVEETFGLPESFPLTFSGTEGKFASPVSVGKTNFLIPGVLEAMPLHLGYIRTAAYSIAEACSQLNAREKNPLSVEQMKLIIAENISVFLKAEIERIQTTVKEDESLFVSIDKAEDIKIHVERLETQIQNMEAFIGIHAVGNQVDTVKGKIETVHNNHAAANDKKYVLAA